MKFAPTVVAAAFAAALAAGAPARAQSTADHSAHHPPSASAAAEPGSDGEVRKVDKAQGKLTLKHGPIKNLDMPAMTMVFKVSDTRLLDGLNQGDKVRFAADTVNGALTVTAIRVVR